MIIYNDVIFDNINVTHTTPPIYIYIILFDFILLSIYIIIVSCCCSSSCCVGIIIIINSSSSSFYYLTHTIQGWTPTEERLQSVEMRYAHYQWHGSPVTTN